jgi:integrase
MTRLKPLPLAAWPARDREARERALAASADIFGDDGRASHLEPNTRRLYDRAYGIWLAFLQLCGALDADLPAHARITPERLDAWIAAMRAAGRQNGTIRLYVTVLHAVLRLIAPEAEVGFLRRPRGVPLSALLPAPPKPFPALDTEDVMHHVRALHRKGLASAGSQEGQLALRDAALLAILLRRAPRVANLAEICLGRHLTERSDGGFDVSFTKEETKNDRALAWPLDAESAAMLRDYLRHGRPRFAGAATTDRLWLGTHRAPLEAVGVAALVRRRTLAWLGEACGPHTARKWLRSTAARRSPEAAFDAAEVMGHGARVSLRHYAEAMGIGAAQRHAHHLRKLRRASAGLAARAFGETPPVRRPLGTRYACWGPTSNPPSAVSATATTSCSPSPSSACPDRGDPATQSESPWRTDSSQLAVREAGRLTLMVVPLRAQSWRRRGKAIG